MKTPVVLGLLLCGGTAFATNGMRMTGFGPVQNSMGGVGVGATLDAASIVTNPAGAIELGGRIDFGATVLNPSPEYSAVGLSAEGIPAGMFVAQDGVTLGSARDAAPIPVFGLIVPLTSRWSFGLGAYGVAGMGVDYAQNLYGGTTFTSYSQMRFTPGAAYKITDQLAVGVTINAMWATMEWNVAGGMGQAPHDTSSAFGLGATVGVKYTPTPWLSVGAAYESRSYFQDFAMTTPARPNPFAGFPGQPAMLPGGVDKVSFDQPQVVTIGAAVRPIERVLVAADLEWINWSQTNGDDRPEMSQNESGAIAWNLGWDDQLVFKAGVEVTALPELKLRAGYNYGKMPLDAGRAFENIAFPAVAEHHLMGGIGVALTAKLGLNVGFMVAPTATLTGANGDAPPALGGNGQGIVSYETRMSQWAIDGGIAYRY